MLINYVPGEECRIAIARDGKLEEFYQERASTESHVGNIYKGRVTNVEPSIQAAFVDFGLERNGFLHISDLHPMYFPGKDREEFEKVGSKTPHRERPPIQKCLRRGQEVLVQVLKEGLGTKGPTLTSYLSIPGRFVVMMPFMQKLGVSRKVDDDDARRAARQMLAELSPPEGFGFIVRTAGIGQTKTELKRDLAYLQRLWKNIEQRRKKIGKVGELYTESDLVIRTIRDVFSTEIDRIVVDDPTAAQRAHDFLAIASPRSRSKVVFYNDAVPMFHRYGLESQIESIHSREVPLPSGAYLVIDQTEALVAIDVNSGKSRDAKDAESNAFNTNKEAADEICRQLRLRDLGGVVVNDFIDMREPKHRRAIESRFRQNLKNDRARTRVGPISQFGLLEMTRQRMRPSFKTSVYTPCTHCNGFGHVKSPESVVLDVMRRLALVLQADSVERVELTISPDVAFQLLNRKRSELVLLERRHQKSVMVRVGGNSIDFVNIAAFDARGAVDLESLAKPSNLPPADEKNMVELKSGKLPPEVVEMLEQAAAEEESLAAEATLEQMLTEGQPEAEAGEEEAGKETSSKKRRRRRRGGRGRGRSRSDSDEKQADQSQQAAPDQPPKPSEHAAEKRAEKRPDQQPDKEQPRRSENRAADSKQSDKQPQKDAAAAVDVEKETSRDGGGRSSSAADQKTSDASKREADGKSESGAAESNGSSQRSRRRRGGRGRNRDSQNKGNQRTEQRQNEPAAATTGGGYSNTILKQENSSDKAKQ